MFCQKIKLIYTDTDTNTNTDTNTDTDTDTDTDTETKNNIKINNTDIMIVMTVLKTIKNIFLNNLRQ